MGTKRPNKRKDWDSILKDLGDRLGFQVIAWNPYPAKRSKVLIRCRHGEKWVYPQGQLNKTSCCRAGSKESDKNPMKGAMPWNKGISCPGLGGRPPGTKNSKPFSSEIREKYSQSRKRITANGQSWSGFQRKGDANKPDKLYFIRLYDGKYKIGRSYKGWLYRKKETLELLGEWSAKSADIWNLEKKILERFREHKAPLTEMSMGRGMTEQFKETLPVLEVITFIEDFLYHVPTASNQSLDCP
jgi:hypothetical protein